MEDIDDYGIRYPELVYDVCLFFWDNTIPTRFCSLLGGGISPSIKPKCAIDFIDKYGETYRDLDTTTCIQPRVVTEICNRLCDLNMLRKMCSSTRDEESFTFYCVFRSPSHAREKRLLIAELNGLVYDFRYIKSANMENVLPIIVKKNGEEHVGTCFKTVYGLVTAKHCIEDMDEVAIKGIDANILQTACILHKENIDLVVIIFPDQRPYGVLLIGGYSVGEQILSMGYPPIPGFDITLSSDIGYISSVDRSYLERNNEFLLITNRISPGDSGGPLFNKKGRVVGIMTNDTKASEGDYAALGLAIPGKYIDDICRENIKYLNPVNFVDM
jgi:hypothetical protein